MTKIEYDFELYDTWDEFKSEFGEYDRHRETEPRWTKLKVKVFQYYSRECAWCGSYAEDIHHEKYTPPDVQTPLEFLVALCEECHTWGPGGCDVEMLYEDEIDDMDEHLRKLKENQGMRGK